MKRRSFFKKLLLGLSVTPLFGVTLAKAAFTFKSAFSRFLRPPGALSESEFLSRCISCGQCAEVCPNQCIKFFGAEVGLDGINTPYIIPREQACILCMKCGDACPTGALKPIKREAEPIIQEVKMGKALVDKRLCLSYQGKTCGVCYRACPLPDVAIRVGMLEQPHVLDACVGCGLCERSCIQIPQAIRIIPTHDLSVSY
ncbi:MAG: 4Fe-4S dicluster domain-containing protein [Motiliproteus sp.]